MKVFSIVAALFAALLCAPLALAGTATVQCPTVQVAPAQVYAYAAPVAVTPVTAYAVATPATVVSARIRLVDRIRSNREHRQALRAARIPVVTAPASLSVGAACVGAEAESD